MLIEKQSPSLVNVKRSSSFLRTARALTFANKRSRLLTLWLIALCLLSIQADRQAQAQSQSKPNIIYIFADDLSSGMLGFTNPNTPIKTPNLDALAAAGMQFTNAYANTICSSSRGSLHTGFHNGHAINDRNTIDFRAEDIMPGAVAKQAGYATACYGKWGYGGSLGTHTGSGGVDSLLLNPMVTNVDTLPTTHGYDDFLGYLHHTQAHRFFVDPLWQADFSSPTNVAHFATGNNAGNNVTNTFDGYTDDHHTWRAMDFITSSAAANTPFMIQMHYNSPHPPFDPGQQLTTDFAGNPRAWDQDYQGLGLTVKQRQLGAMITRLDEHIGALVDHLRDPNGDGNESDSILENTVVMFTSDNGGEPTDSINFADWNELGGNCLYGVKYRGGKRDLFEGGVRVPFFAYWPGTIAPNQFADEIIDLADFMPTVADLAGIEAPIGLDGVSFAGLLTGEGMFRRRSSYVWENYAAFDGPDPDGRSAEWSVLKDNFKMIHFRDGSEELYHIGTDPDESSPLNLVSFANLRASLRETAEAQGATQRDNSYSARHVDWVGGDQDSTTSSANWSNYGFLQEVWVSVIANSQSTDSTIRFVDADFLGLEVKGDSALQTIRVNPLRELGVRNELRIGDNGRAHVDSGTLNCSRWLDILSGGQLTGAGDVAGQLYNWGAIAPGLPNDLQSNDGSSGAVQTGGPVAPGITLSPDQPSGNVILNNFAGNTIFTNIQSQGGNAGARGQNFVIAGQPGTTVEIGGVTIQKESSQNFNSNNEMTIVIFSGDNFNGVSATNTTPAGLAAAPGITILRQQTFGLPSNIPANRFVTFGFANPVNVSPGQTLGMMVFSNVSFRQLEGNGGAGGRLLYRANSGVSTAEAGSRDMNFAILGSTALPSSPGQSASFGETAKLNLDGDLFHQPSGQIQLQVSGTDNSDPEDYQFDQLVVGGAMTAGGSLSIELLADYTPQDGDSISLIQATNVIGDFSSIDVQGVPDGFEADLQVGSNEVVLTLAALDEFLLGDANLDGVVNFMDIAPFISLLTNGEFLDQADTDRNGVINFLDIAPFINILAGN